MESLGKWWKGVCRVWKMEEMMESEGQMLSCTTSIYNIELELVKMKENGQWRMERDGK